MSQIKSFLVVSRANIQVASLPTASLGVLLAARGWDDLFNLPVFLYVLFFFIVLTYSCQVNCRHDVDVDSRSKRQFSRAVREIGISRLKAAAWVELFAAAGTVVLICLLKQRTVYLLLILGIGIGHAYSAPPLRIKKRGVLSALPVMFGLYFLPIAAGGYLVLDRISLYILLFGLGYALIMEGITIVNTCEDYVEDEAAGIKTLAHVLGIRKTLRLGAFFVAAGGALDVGLLSLKMPSLGQKPLSFVLILFLSAVFLVSVGTVSAALFSLSRVHDPCSGSKEMAGRMRRWFLLTRYPLFFAGLVFIL
jgi:4-hydroxybenzoate polyprenyltransferase